MEDFPKALTVFVKALMWQCRETALVVFRDFRECSPYQHAEPDLAGLLLYLLGFSLT